MPSERLTGLLSHKALWDIENARFAVYRQTFLPLGKIDAPWYYVLGAPDWAEDLDRQAWIEDVKQRLGLITYDDSEETRVARLELARKDNPWPDLSRSPWLPPNLNFV